MTNHIYCVLVLLQILALAACGGKKENKSDAPQTNPDTSSIESLSLTEKNIKITGLSITDDGKPAWIQSDDQNLFLMIDGKQSFAIKTPESSVLARAVRASTEGVAELQASALGKINLVLFDSDGNASSVAVPELTSQVWGDEDEGRSFDEMCKQRKPVLRTPPEYAPMSKFSLISADDESKWVILISTCGYIDVAVVSNDGDLIKRETVFEPKYEEDVTRMFLALSAELKQGPGSVLADVMVEDDPSDYKMNANDSRFYRFFSVSDEAKVRAESSVKVEDNQHVFSFDSSAKKIVLVGTQSKPIEGVSNDTSEDDAWIALVDKGKSKLIESHVLHHKRDDFYRAVSFSKDGKIFVTGDTDRHHVDTGSWDGGAEVLLSRYSSELKLEETITFGQDRMDTGLEIVVGEKVFVAGSFDRIPNNHLPKDQDWFRGFILSLPLEDWGKIE